MKTAGALEQEYYHDIIHIIEKKIKDQIFEGSIDVSEEWGWLSYKSVVYDLENSGYKVDTDKGIISWKIPS